MKQIKKLSGIFAVCAALVFVWSCASAPPKAEQETGVLDHAGASFNLPEPAWLLTYVSNGQSNIAVEKLPEYKDKYCFVISTIEQNRDYAIAWVRNASGPQQIAAKISTTVTSSASNALSGEKDGDVESNLAAAAEAMSNASFNGAVKEADWWRMTKNKDTGVTECQAFALWVIDRKQLDQQVAAVIQNIVDNNKAMSAAERAIYADLINQIRSVGFVNS